MKKRAKNRLKVLILSLLLFAVGLLEGQINLISYNIRYNNPGDGEHAWPHRKANVINLLKFHRADVFCLQEALEGQVEEIDSAFMNFSYVGVGRDDGKAAGEYAPIFYNEVKYSLKDAGHFWLSDTPDVPGLGWDAACIRICTWIALRDKSSGKDFLVYNTHFDHVGVEARKNAARQIFEEMKKRSGGAPVFLCGDFNLPPESEPIKILSSLMNDTYSISELPPHGARGTWTGFTYDHKAGARIDYIFVSDGVRVLRHAALTDSRDRNFFSDHLPVLAEIDW